MERIEVSSSNMESIGWENGILEITFKRNGTVYEFDNVPEEVFEEMKEADSVGKFFHANIRDQYISRKVS